jgi:predicted nucleotidyltransferase
MTESGESAVDSVDLDEMRAYLASTAVEFAVLFGSHARGTADAASDVDIALGFPESLTDRERFRLRNRVDAELQAYADSFVNISDIESLPTPVAHAALRDRIVIVGDEATVKTLEREVAAEYEAKSKSRKRDREAFIERLAQGDN